MEKPPFQFGLKGVFVAITAVAVLMAFPTPCNIVFIVSIGICQGLLICDQIWSKRRPPTASAKTPHRRSGFLA